MSDLLAKELNLWTDAEQGPTVHQDFTERSTRHHATHALLEYRQNVLQNGAYSWDINKH